MRSHRTLRAHIYGSIAQLDTLFHIIYSCYDNKDNAEIVVLGVLGGISSVHYKVNSQLILLYLQALHVPFIT